MTGLMHLLLLALLAGIVTLGIWAMVDGAIDDPDSAQADMASALVLAVLVLCLIGLAL